MLTENSKNAGLFGLTTIKKYGKMLIIIFIDKSQEDKKMKKAKSILALLMALVMVMSFALTGSAANSAAVAEETENNGTFKAADAFGFATKIKGTLGTAADEDYFSFTADADGLATVAITHNEITDASQDIAYFEVSVYDSAEKEIVMFRSTGAEKETLSPSFAITAKATYFIKVTMGSVHSETLEYAVTAAFDKGARTEKEPNNQAATATALELSTSGDAKPYYGTIASTGNDVDFYKITPTKTGVIYLYLYNGNVPADFKATLYTHYEIADGVLSEEPITSITINSNNEVAKSVAIGVHAKEYMLKVEGLNGKTGGYRTRVFFQPVSDAEMEFNNLPHVSNKILVGSPLRGTLSHDTDIDFYSFKADANNVGYKISLNLAETNAPKTGSWYITITEGKNQGVVADTQRFEVTAKEGAVISTEALVAGRNYYIKIEKGSTLTTEVYKLGITAIEPEKNPDKPSSDKGFGEQVKEYFDIFWEKNFSNWVDDGVNFIGMITSLLPGFLKALPELFKRLPEIITRIFSFIG